MKPKQFDYVKATDLDEVLHLLDAEDRNVKVLAGGQSLVPMLNMRLAEPELLIDINGLSGLGAIRAGAEALHIGALVRHQELLDSELVGKRFPLLVEAVKHIGYPAIRNRGTIGGSLVHNEPSAELGAVLSCLRAEVVLTSLSEGTRVLPLKDFFVTTFLTAIKRTEVLTEVRVPFLPPAVGHAFRELSKRGADLAIVVAACIVATDEKGRITDVSLALGGAAERPEVMDLSGMLVGKKLTEDLLQQATDSLKARLDPPTDNVASGAYKKHLAGELSQQCLSEAYALSLRK